MKVRLGVTRSANEGSELWYQVLEKSVGPPFLSLDDAGDVLPRDEGCGGERRVAGIQMSTECIYGRQVKRIHIARANTLDTQ